MFAHELTQTVVVAFRPVVRGLPVMQVHVPLLRVMTAIHPVPADVVDHVERELSLTNNLQTFGQLVEVSDRLLEPVQWTVHQAQDGPDECTEGKVFLLGVVSLEPRLLNFGNDGLAEVERTALRFDQRKLFSECDFDSRYKV